MKDEFVIDDGGRWGAGFTNKATAGDCVARAVAIASGRPYREVYERLAQGHATQRVTAKQLRGRRNHAVGALTASHGIWTKRKWFRDYMAELGFTWVPTMEVGQGCKVHLDARELPTGRLVIAVSRHYTAMIDGVIHDAYDPRRDESFSFEPDWGQPLKPNQGRNQNGVWTRIGGRCVYGYWQKGDI